MKNNHKEIHYAAFILLIIVGILIFGIAALASIGGASSVVAVLGSIASAAVGITAGRF